MVDRLIAAANDILVGDANPNYLKGGTGRNLIIGGDGADTLVGGGGDNILIGGHTFWDTTPDALQRILHEFLQTYDTDPTTDFTIRVNNIRMGKGTLAGTGIHLQGSRGKLTQTVFDDGVKNTLTGGGGLNWFLLDRLDVYFSTNANDRHNFV
jgi:Ca2+-binding RTX toxin-like protein